MDVLSEGSLPPLAEAGRCLNLGGACVFSAGDRLVTFCLGLVLTSCPTVPHESPV